MLIAEELLLLLLDEDSGKQSGWVHAVDPALEGALRLDAELGATTPSGDDKVVERVASGLVERGVLDEQRGKVLGLFKSVRFPERDPEPERELRARLRRVLVDGEEPDERTALLLMLLVPLDMVERVVERDEHKAAEARAKAIAASGPVGDHVAAKVREEVNQMVMTAVFAATTTAATTTSN